MYGIWGEVRAKGYVSLVKGFDEDLVDALSSSEDDCPSSSPSSSSLSSSSLLSSLPPSSEDDDLATIPLTIPPSTSTCHPFASNFHRAPSE